MFTVPSNLAALIAKAGQGAAATAAPVASLAVNKPVAAAPVAAAPAVALPSNLAALAAARAAAAAPAAAPIAAAPVAAARTAAPITYYYLPGASGSLSKANAPAGANLVQLSPYTSAADQQYIARANLASKINGSQYSDANLASVVSKNAAPSAPVVSGLPGTFTPETPLYNRYPTAAMDPTSVEFVKGYGNDQYLPFATNQGMSAVYQPDKLDPYRSAGVYLDPNAQYRITDRASGKVLYTGTGEEGLKNTFALSQKLSAEQGNDANWGVETYDPNSKAWSLSAEDNPNKSALGTIASIGLPILGAIALPGIGGALGLGSIGTAGAAGTGLMGTLGAAGTAGLGAALGSTISGVAQGQSFGDILKGAALSGLGTYAGASLLGNLGSSASKLTPSAAFSKAFSPEYMASLASGSGGALGSTAGSTLGSTLGSTAGGALSDAGITVLGKIAGSGLTNLGSSLGAGALGALTNLGIDAATQNAINQYANRTANTGTVDPVTGEIVVTAAKSPGALANLGINAATQAAINQAASQTTSQQPPENVDPNEIVVSKKPTSIGDFGSFANLGVDAATQAAINQAAGQTASTAKPQSTLDKVVNYMRLAGLGTALIGDLFGGGGKTSGSGATIPKGFGGGLSDVFSSTTLPAPNMPGLGTNAGARTAADLASRGLSSNVDYYRYGYGPEQSFFNYVPQGARNTSTAYTGYAEGGEVHDTDLAELGAQSFSAGNSRRKRKPSFHGGFNVNDDGLETNYSLAVPLGDATFGVDAYGSGIVPDVYNLRGQYDLGDASLRASHMLGGGSEYGISAPLFGGDFDVSAYAPQGFVPEGIRASYRRRFEEGGYAVGGPGDGREDKIPAMLSDGEYVMDAETVAMLGNGSSKAGAEALDKFRVNIRKHKGRDLAKGNFSVNAKKPEQYLKRKTA